MKETRPASRETGWPLQLTQPGASPGSPVPPLLPPRSRPTLAKGISGAWGTQDARTHIHPCRDRALVNLRGIFLGMAV